MKITFTESAYEQIEKQMSNRYTDEHIVRLFVQGIG